MTRMTRKLTIACAIAAAFMGMVGTVAAVVRANESEHLPIIVGPLTPPDQAYVHCASPGTAQPVQIRPELVLVICREPTPAPLQPNEPASAGRAIDAQPSCNGRRHCHD